MTLKWILFLAECKVQHLGHSQNTKLMGADLEERQQLDNTQHTQKGYIALYEVAQSDFTALKHEFKMWMCLLKKLRKSGNRMQLPFTEGFLSA